MKSRIYFSFWCRETKIIKKEFLNLLVFILLFFSCSKEASRSNFLAGENNLNCVYHEFKPPLVVDLKLDTLINFKLGKDSIDINMDGNYEIIINQKIATDSSVSKIGKTFHYPFCQLILKNGIEVATKDMCYNCGHGECSSSPFIDTLARKSNIARVSDWFGGPKRTMWINPPVSDYPYGWWYEISKKEMYIGIRIGTKGHKKTTIYKYGWIKVNALSRDSISFLSYAIEK